MRPATSLLILAVGAAGALGGLGCANQASQPVAAASPVSGEADRGPPAPLQSTIASSQAQIERTLHSLRLLVAAREAGAAYEAFAVEVDRLRWSAMQCQRDAQAAQRHNDDYLGEWEIVQAGTQSDDVRRTNERRREDITRGFKQLQDSHDAAREAFLPLMQDFEEIRHELAGGPTAAAVAQVAPAARVKNVEDKAARLRLALDAVEADRLALANALARTQRAELDRRPSSPTQTQ